MTRSFLRRPADFALPSAVACGSFATLAVGALLCAAPAAAQQAAGLIQRPIPQQTADTTIVQRPPDVPRLHHTHLNTVDPEAALDWFEDVWPQGERGEVAGRPAFVTDVPVLFDRVEEPPTGGWDPERHRAFPQSAFWHIGAFAGTTARFEALEARGHTVLPLARSANDAEGVVRSGLAFDPAREGGFGYLVGPEGSLVEITGGPSTEPRFAHVHLFGERPRCAANWYAETLGFELPPVEDPGTGESAPRERYEPCEAERAEPSWPSLDPAGTIRAPTASIRHGSGSISIYPRQCLGAHCEVDEPLVPSRGQVLDHVAFEVDDIDSWIAWLEQEGVTILRGRTFFGGPGDDAWSVLIEGPDGLAIELVQPRRPQVIDRIVEERWIHEGQAADFVERARTRMDFHLTYLSRRGRPGGLDSYGLRTRFGDAFLSMRAPRNTFNRIRAPAPDVEYPPAFGRTWEESRARALVQWRMEALTLPAAPFWEVPVNLPEGAIETGTTWVDTVSHHAHPALWLEERLDGVWRYTALGDTIVDGRPRPLVAVTAEVEYAAWLPASLDLGGYLDDPPRIRREASGTLSGRMVLDPDRGLRLAGADTTRLAGTVTMVEPDGTELSSPATYERIQRWELVDSTAWAADLEARREAAADRRTGMLILPTDSLAERLEAGDVALQDSLLARYADARTPEQRSEILSMLTRNVRGEDWRARVEPIHAAAGDSAYVISRRLGRQGTRSFGSPGGPVFDAALAEELVRRLSAPEDLWRLAIHPRLVTRSLVEALLNWTTAGEAPTPCDEGACRHFADLALASDEPAVHDLGVVTDFLLDPADGFEALARRREAGSWIAESVWDVATGLPDETGVSRLERVAEDASDWTAWRDAGVSGRPSPALRRAIDLFQRRTGWDPVSELRDARSTAETDSARVVLGWALDLLGASAETSPAEIATILRSPTSSDVAFGEAVRGAGLLLRDAAPDSALAAGAVTELLETLLDDAERPPVFRPLDRLDYATDPIRSAAQGFHGVRNRGFILRPEDFPSGFDVDRLTELATGRAVVQDSAAAAAWDEREGGVVIKVQPVVREGDLAHFGWSWTVYDRRDPDQAPFGYSGGGNFLLVRVADEWRIASASAWIT